MMKLKATNPLVLFVGALAIGLAGCADDVIITEPPPPPPPPPPEAAEISLGAITDFETGAEFLTDVVEGRIGVFINFDTGGFEAAALDLLVDSDVFGCQTFSGQGAVGISADVQTVVCSLDTAEGVGACQGSTLQGRFDNGPHTIAARLTLQDGSQVTATRGEDLIFANSNLIIIVPDDIGPRVVGLDAEEWWGGPRDLTWFACPILFTSAIQVCEITARTSGEGTSLLLGGPSGASTSETSSEPFLYTASYRDVAGVPVDAFPQNEDRVELDDHEVNPITVLDCDGVDITSSFSGNLIGDLRNIDTSAPMCDEPMGTDNDGECEPVIDGADMWVLQNGLYSDGSIVLDDVFDFGVGIASVILDAHDFADGDPANQTLFQADVGDVADLPEDDGCGSGLSTDHTAQQGCAGVEAGVPVDAYFVFISEVKDLLDNALGDGDNDLQILDKFDNSLEFGTDFTEPDLTDVEPPTETPLFVWNPDLGVDYTAGSPAAIDATRTCPSVDTVNDCESIMWESVDPDLVSGDDPSGVEDGSCGALCADDDANDHVPAGDGNFIHAEIDDSPGNVDNGELLAASNSMLGTDMFEAFFCADAIIGGGPPFFGGAECDGTDDGTYVVDIFSSDKAVKANNVNKTPTTFILDTSPPVIGFGGITGLNASNAATVEFVLDASVVDRNGDGTAVALAEVQVTIEGPLPDLAFDEVCGTGDELIAASDVLVTPNDDTSGATVTVDVTAQVNTNSGQLVVTFTAQNQSGNLGLGDFLYCFEIEADDGALRKDGSADGLDISSDAGKNFTWQ